MASVKLKVKGTKVIEKKPLPVNARNTCLWAATRDRTVRSGVAAGKTAARSSVVCPGAKQQPSSRQHPRAAWAVASSHGWQQETRLSGSADRLAGPSMGKKRQEVAGRRGRVEKAVNKEG